MRGRCVPVCSPGPELGMEGVGTAMGMPIPLLPLFSLLLLPPLLPLGEERERTLLLTASRPDCTAGNAADIWTLLPLPYVELYN